MATKGSPALRRFGLLLRHYSLGFYLGHHRADFYEIFIEVTITMPGA